MQELLSGISVGHFLTLLIGAITAYIGLRLADHDMRKSLQDILDELAEAKHRLLVYEGKTDARLGVIEQSGARRDVELGRHDERLKVLESHLGAITRTLERIEEKVDRKADRAAGGH